MVGQNITAGLLISAMGIASEVIAAGAMRGAWTIGRKPGACAETILLQQSWLWLAGLHGIVRQHFIVCWSADIAMQSANCISRRKLAAATDDVILRNIRLP